MAYYIVGPPLAGGLGTGAGARDGVSAAFWMNLQKRYELEIARERICLNQFNP